MAKTVKQNIVVYKGSFLTLVNPSIGPHYPEGIKRMSFWPLGDTCHGLYLFAVWNSPVCYTIPYGTIQ